MAMRIPTGWRDERRIADTAQKRHAAQECFRVEQAAAAKTAATEAALREMMNDLFTSEEEDVTREGQEPPPRVDTVQQQREELRQAEAAAPPPRKRYRIRKTVDAEPEAAAEPAAAAEHVAEAPAAAAASTSVATQTEETQRGTSRTSGAAGRRERKQKFEDSASEALAAMREAPAEIKRHVGMAREVRLHERTHVIMHSVCEPARLADSVWNYGWCLLADTCEGDGCDGRRDSCRSGR